MVRLLLEWSIVVGCDAHQFQSHNGAIAANEFLPALVRDAVVSIPQWCDCCELNW